MCKSNDLILSAASIIVQETALRYVNGSTFCPVIVDRLHCGDQDVVLALDSVSVSHMNLGVRSAMD